MGSGERERGREREEEIEGGEREQACRPGGCGASSQPGAMTTRPPTIHPPSAASPLTHLRLLPAREGEQSRELIKSLSAARHKPKNSSYISAETLKPWGSPHQPDLFPPHTGHPHAAMGDPGGGDGLRSRVLPG